MIAAIAFPVLFCVAPIVAIVFLRSPLLVACFISAPWFWCAWTAAECNDPLASLELFLVGAALLFVGLDIQWFHEDPSRARTR